MLPHSNSPYLGHKLFLTFFGTKEQMIIILDLEYVLNSAQRMQIPSPDSRENFS